MSEANQGTGLKAVKTAEDSGSDGASRGVVLIRERTMQPAKRGSVIKKIWADISRLFCSNAPPSN